MSATLLDATEYGRLLSETLPATIHTDREHDRLLGIVRRIMDKPDDEITAEEGRLLEMLGMIIEEYEDRRYPFPPAKPHKMLAGLLEERGMSPSDLYDILPKSRISEILNGKRGISKSQAKQLAERFRVPVDLFL
jgi:HTH-type transcriptional regulator / antitoxin HigA